MSDKNSNIFIKEFAIDEANLTEVEKKVLLKLEKAAELIAPIYALQINDNFPGANFYPHDIKPEELLEASEENTLILNPYTVVERNKGKLEATAYHIKYQEQLKPVVALIRDAAKLSPNKEFAKRLEVQADALEDGSYEAADIYWLTMEPYKIDIIIGPSERYEDRLLFKKTCYSATVGVMNRGATQKAQGIRDAMLSSHKKNFSLSQRVEAGKRLQIRIDHTSILSGLDARAHFSAAFLPNDPHLIEKYGSEVIIFGTALKQIFEDHYLPIFRKIFELNFQKRYEVESLLEASELLLIIRELSTSLVKYHHAEERLGKYYSVVNEMASHVLALKNAGSLLLKDVLTQKELEGMMVMLLCRFFSGIINSQKIKSLTHYSQGYVIAINYFLESGALRQSQGLSWVNFTKMFVALNELSNAVEKILAFGDEEDAKNLIEEYGNIQTSLDLIPTK